MLEVFSCLGTGCHENVGPKNAILCNSTVTYVASEEVKGDQHDNNHHGHEVLGWHCGCSELTRRKTAQEMTLTDPHTSLSYQNCINL